MAWRSGATGNLRPPGDRGSDDDLEERLERLRAALQQASKAGLSVDVTKEADEALVALKARRAVWGELEQAAASLQSCDRDGDEEAAAALRTEESRPGMP